MADARGCCDAIACCVRGAHTPSWIRRARLHVQRTTKHAQGQTVNDTRIDRDHLNHAHKPSTPIRTMNQQTITN